MVDGRVVIVGGGIGGLTTALALVRRGIPCEVHERAPELREIGAGLGVWAAPLRVFDRLRIGQAVRALSRPWEVAGLRSADGRFLIRYTAEQLAARLGEPTIGVHRGELQSLLLGELPEGVVRTSRECTGIERRSSSTVRVRFADGSSVDAAAVIGADGQRSRVRAHLVGERPLDDCRCVAWRGTAPEPDGEDWHSFTGETWGDDARFGILPIGGRRVTWYATARRFLDAGGRDEVLARFGGWHDPIPALVEATPDEAIWRDHIYDRWPLRRWSHGRVTLLGDAAHPMTPELGQGACQAILDAWAVAEELDRHHDPATAFTAYERRRRHRAWGVTLAARRAAAVGSLEGHRIAAIRERVAAATPASALLRQIALVAGG